MSRDYHSVDLPRTSSPWAAKEAIQQAIISYSSETEQDIVPRASKRGSTSLDRSAESKVSKLSSLTRHSSAAKRQSKESRPRLETIESYAEKPVATPENELVEYPPSKNQASKADSIGATFGLADLRLEEFNSYSVWNASYSNMRVCPVNLIGGSYYYVENRSFIPSRPGVTLHAGTDKSAPTVAVAHLDYFSTSNQLGLGDPQRDPTNVRWERLHKESFWTHMRYSFSFEWEDGDVRKYEFHRTKNIYW